MVIGQSRYFSLEAQSGIDISSYTARYQLIKGGSIKEEGALTNNGQKFDLKLQTDTLQAGSYEIRVFVTDNVDGFIDVFRDTFVLE